MYSAQTGDAESQVKLGEMYLKGDELEKDVEQAVYWFKEGAKLKYPRAYFMLGVCFILGEGVEKDTDKAEGFLKQAVKAGYEPAVRLIESGYSTEVIEDELDNQ
jgi:TPR repeat protein